MLDDAGCIAFRELIRCLVEAPVLAYANFGKPFRLETDSSRTGLGAILFQEDDEGRHRVIAYGSRALRPSERLGRYSAFKLELLAIKWAVTETFRDYLLGHKCVVVTDHHPLKFLETANMGSTGMRWLQQLSSFEYEIVYRPGKDNQASDALSRLEPCGAPEEGSSCSAVVIPGETVSACSAGPISGTLFPVSFCNQIEACRNGGTPCFPGHTMAQLVALQQRDSTL